LICLAANIVNDLNFIFAYGWSSIGRCCFCAGYVFEMHCARLFPLVYLYISDLSKLLEKDPDLSEQKLARLNILGENGKSPRLFSLLSLLF
jgi:hypothetical protein